MTDIPAARVGRSLVPIGDMGLGLCLQCLGALIADPENADQPRFAVTLYPMPHTVATPAGPVTGLVAVPACLQCLAVAGQQQQKRPLLVVGGM